MSSEGLLGSSVLFGVGAIKENSDWIAGGKHDDDKISFMFTRRFDGFLLDLGCIANACKGGRE